MKELVQKKQEAIRLRKLGFSYRDIIEKVSVAKSSLSAWFKYLPLSASEIDFLKEKIASNQDYGRIKSSLRNREKRIEREEKIKKSASEDFQKFFPDPLFIGGICLYWAEGAKRNACFQFINSDPDMIIVMIRWCEKYLGISRQNLDIRLYMHKIYQKENCEKYWSEKIEISEEKFKKTIYKPTPHKIKKNANFKVCLRVSIYSVDVFRTVMTWQNKLLGYYK